MANDDFPDHLTRLIDNTSEVIELLSIHTTITGGTPGRHHKGEVLNKSALVLLVACWEAYIEDLATSSFQFLIDRATTPNVFPNNVLTEATKPIISSEDKRRIWELAGDGWKEILQAHKDNILDKHVGKLNTPRPKQIDEMFEKLIGFKKLSSNWKWRGLSNNNVKKQLDELITTRGEIAHKVKASEFVKKNYVNTIPELIQRLAAISSNRVGVYLEARTDEEPWGQYSFGKTG